MIKQQQFTMAMTEAKITLETQEKTALTEFYKDYQNDQSKDILLEKLMGAVGLPAQTYGSAMRPQTRVRVLSESERNECM